MSETSDYLSNLANTTASNYALQPGSNQPPIPTPIDPEDHPANNMPDKQKRELGLNRLRVQFGQSDAKNWMNAAGKDSQTIDYLVRGR